VTKAAHSCAGIEIQRVAARVAVAVLAATTQLWLFGVIRIGLQQAMNEA